MPKVLFFIRHVRPLKRITIRELPVAKFYLIDSGAPFVVILLTLPGLDGSKQFSFGILVIKPAQVLIAACVFLF